MTEIKMTEVQKLDQEIQQARAAATQARKDAEQASTDYGTAIEAGDVAGADSALQAKAMHERTEQIQNDRAAALEKRRPEAEKIDFTPLAHEAIKKAQHATDLENLAEEKVYQAIDNLEQAMAILKDSFKDTDEALSYAHEMITKARLHKREGVDRKAFFYSNGKRIDALYRSFVNTQKRAPGIIGGDLLAPGRKTY